MSSRDPQCWLKGFPGSARRRVLSHFISRGVNVHFTVAQDRHL